MAALLKRKRNALEGEMVSNEQVIKALKAIRQEARKNKPNPDKIFKLADEAIAGFERAQRNG